MAVCSFSDLEDGCPFDDVEGQDAACESSGESAAFGELDWGEKLDEADHRVAETSWGLRKGDVEQAEKGDECSEPEALAESPAFRLPDTCPETRPMRPHVTRGNVTQAMASSYGRLSVLAPGTWARAAGRLR